ncbi:DegV family protein [Peptostreptococcaceae bacterium OttesenSCG-928-C18]|nr:DegV family protein [Peptostreptococcaceae bacterium OttesenSCG-928-C18]
MNERIIIADSSCDLNKELVKKLDVKLVPFNIDVNGTSYMDDGSMNLVKFLKEIDRSEKAPITAAPSPYLFMNNFEGAKEVFVITISSKLSATYGNAELGRTMYLENNDAKIHVFDSKSAVSGETAIAVKIKDCLDKNLSFEEVVDVVEDFISNMKTYFILDKFDTLVKNGRMSKFTGTLAKALSFKPVMTAIDGEIQVHSKTRGYNKAASRLVELIGEEGSNIEDKTLIIAHCQASDRAKSIKKDIASKYDFKDIEIVETGMLSSVYANTGGVILAF